MTTRQNHTVPPVAADKITEFLTAYLSLDLSSEDDLPEFPPAESDYPDFSGSGGLTYPDISPDPLLELMRKGIAEAEAEIARRDAEEAGPQRRRPNRSEAVTLLSLAAFATALPATAALERLYWPGTVTVLQVPPGYESAVAQALSWPTLRHLRALAAVGTDHADPKLRVFKSGASASRDRTADQRNFRAKLEPLLEQGASILLVTADRDVIDSELAEVTVLHLALPRPTPEAVLAVLRLTHPDDWEAADITTLLPSPADLARLSPRSIGAAFRAETAAEAARRLADLARSSAAATGVTLDDVYGQPEAVRALRMMATDLSRWAQGSLDWAQVTASGLLFGPPGTGKSLMAQALAGTAGIPLISTSYADCQRHGHQGDMLAALSAKVSEAIRLAPSVFFIDEIDSFAKRGGNGQTDRYLRGVVTEGMFHPSMKSKMDALEAQKAGLEAKLAALPAPSPVILHPGIADVYAAKVSDLAAALNDAESRPEAVEILRGLIEKIVLRPDADAANGHVVELFGELGSILSFCENGIVQNAKNHAVCVGLRQMTMVAGAGFEPAAFRL